LPSCYRDAEPDNFLALNHTAPVARRSNALLGLGASNRLWVWDMVTGGDSKRVGSVGLPEPPDEGVS